MFTKKLLAILVSSTAAFTFAASTLAGSRANAEWSPAAIQFGETQFGYFPGPQNLTPLQRGAMASIWGAGMRDFRFQANMDADEQFVHLPAYFRKDLRVFLREQDHPAPLVVVVPGIFANGDQGSAQQLMQLYSKLGYHVLTVPNCWSRDLAKAEPSYTDEYPSGEAKVATELTKWAIGQIGQERVTNVSLIGESLGALLVAVVYSRDPDLYKGGATMTWPPIALHDAVGELDYMMTSTDHLYEKKCHGLIKRLKTKWRILRGKYITEPKPDEIECAPAIVAQYSFRQELIKLAKTINKVEKLNREPAKDLTFEQFIHRYAPRYASALKSTDEYGSLQYWLSRLSPAAAKRTRILTSEDDFLNIDQSWSTPGLVNDASNQLIVAHWGGHIGLTDTKQFEALLETQFQLQ